MSKQEIDLWKLFKAVGKRGGYEQVTQDRTWKDICRVMRVSEDMTAPLAPAGFLGTAELQRFRRLGHAFHADHSANSVGCFRLISTELHPIMQVDETGTSPHTLRLAYQRHLLAFEEHCSMQAAADAAAAQPGRSSNSTRKGGKGKGVKRALQEDDATQAAQILEAMLGSNGDHGQLDLSPPNGIGSEEQMIAKAKRIRRAKVGPSHLGPVSLS